MKRLRFVIIAILTLSNAYADKGTLDTTKSNSTNKFHSSQILTHEIKNGYAWTLTTRLGYFLRKAQKEYGSRDKSWTILGIEFIDKGPPSIWYPYSGVNAKFIAIQLTSSAANDKKRALFQLAHETIHVLSPNGSDNESSVFEEGIAAYFSIHALEGAGININAQYIAAKTYTQAYIAVSYLYKLHPDTGKRIKALRAKGETLSSMSKKTLMKAFPKADDKLATLLIQKFSTLIQL